MGFKAALSQIFGRAPVAGKDRWPIKVGTDSEAVNVPLAPVPSTIEQLTNLSPPINPIGRTEEERAIYSIPCTITMWKMENDGDHHLVLSDGARTMIAEIPDPQFVGPTSPWLNQITAARQQFDQWPRIGKPVVVTGVAFFDHAHSQTGAALNQIELHPVLSIVAPSDAPPSSPMNNM